MIPPIADRFVAGTTHTAALDRSQVLAQDEVGSILNRLGEHYHEEGPAREDTEHYLHLADELSDMTYDACISVKPSQIGISVSDGVFRENLKEIAARCEADDVFLWIDMEDHTTTETTVEAFELVGEDHDDIGLCLQSNLKRTSEDLERLEDHPGKIRLVKGAYNEPDEVAYQSKERVDEAFMRDQEYLFTNRDGGIAVASHDPEMIEHAKRLHEDYGTGFEFQMLMGVRESAQRELASSFPVFQYVPYGGAWFSYFYRRVRERKENLRFALRAVLGR